MSERGFPHVGEDEAMTLYLASLAGEAELARQLERMGLSDGESCVRDAAWLKPILWAAAEKARGA